MKALFAALAALSLALAAGSASAAPALVSFSSHALQDASGFGTAFTETRTFTLAGDSWVTGNLQTVNGLSGRPAVDVQSVLLRRTGTALAWDETVAIDWDVAEDGVEHWSLSTRQLAAGEWELVVSGVSYADKAGNGFDAELQLPEPQSFALAALALVGAGVARRRRAA